MQFGVEGVLPIHMVAFFGISDVMSRLISTGCDLEAVGSVYGHTPLVWLLRVGMGPL